MCVCVCVCVCVNRLHQQSPSWWYSIAKTSVVHNNKTPIHKLVGIQKPKRHPFQSTLAWSFSAAALYVLQRKGEQKCDIWRLVEETSGAANVCILELCARVGAEHSSIHSIHPHCKLHQFIQTLTKLLPCCCCFALDHISYTRWLSVYLRDMCQIGGTHQCIKPFAMVDLFFRKCVVLSQP